jgi:hypothetical protein
MAIFSKIKTVLKKMVVPVLLILLLGSIGATFYMYQQLQTNSGDATALGEEEVAQLVAKVGELIVLPSDELPTIATVADPEKLKDQAFFVNAKAGDRVLLYTKAKKAILYDPEAHKIVEVSPINIGDTQPAVEPAVAGDSTESDVTDTGLGLE